MNGVRGIKLKITCLVLPQR
uniref:Uncharacterized protein n=1 Tax=Arundo donax TaxID=35708 RepID=A0A0A9C5N9_ARUDO